MLSNFHFSLVDEWKNLDKTGNKLVYGLSEAEWCPKTHNKNPPINFLGKTFITKNSKWPTKY